MLSRDSEIPVSVDNSSSLNCMLSVFYNLMNSAKLMKLNVGRGQICNANKASHNHHHRTGTIILLHVSYAVPQQQQKNFPSTEFTKKGAEAFVRNCVNKCFFFAVRARLHQNESLKTNDAVANASLNKGNSFSLIL